MKKKKILLGVALGVIGLTATSAYAVGMDSGFSGWMNHWGMGEKMHDNNQPNERLDRGSCHGNTTRMGRMHYRQ